MTRTQLFDAITEMGGVAYKSWKKADLERVYNELVAPAQDTPAQDTPAEDTPAEDTPAEDTPARLALDSVHVPTVSISGIIANTPAPAPAPIAFTPARITPAPAQIARQDIAPIAPATPAHLIASSARPHTPAITETSKTGKDKNDTPTEYYTRLDGKECVTQLTDSDVELFAFIRNSIYTKFGHNVNVTDIPLVAKKDDTKDDINKVTLKSDRSAGVASANYVHITTFRNVKKVFDTDKKLKKAGEDNTTYETVQVIIATLTINNYGPVDSRYYFDPREASQKDIDEFRYVLAPDADGNIIKAKVNKNTGRMVQRVRPLDFILSHTVKREIDVHLERELRNNDRYGRYYTYFGTERLVD